MKCWQIRETTLLGGPGSGNYGHRGRPGKRGGSAPRAAWRVTGTRYIGYGVSGNISMLGDREERHVVVKPVYGENGYYLDMYAKGLKRRMLRKEFSSEKEALRAGEDWMKSPAHWADTGKVTADYFSEGQPGYRLIPKYMGKEARQDIVEVLSSYKLPISHLDGLRRFTDKYDKKYYYEDLDGFLKKKRGSPFVQIAAYYNGRSKQITLSRAVIDDLAKPGADKRAQMVIAHELGHFVQLQSTGSSRKMVSEKKMVGPYVAVESRPGLYFAGGYRPYSLSNYREFFADSYMNWITKPETRPAISEAMTAGGVDFRAFMEGE